MTYHTYTARIYDTLHSEDGPLAIIEQDRPFMGRDFLRMVDDQMFINNERFQHAILYRDNEPFFAEICRIDVDGSSVYGHVWGGRWSRSSELSIPFEYERHITIAECGRCYDART